MRFAFTALFVKSMAKTLAFYNDILEMPILHRDGNDMVVLGVQGEPGLELIASENEVSYSGFVLSFEVERLDALKEKLAQNGHPIEQEFHRNGATLAFLKGPNGEDVELIAR